MAPDSPQPSLTYDNDAKVRTDGRDGESFPGLTSARGDINSSTDY
jgi:hypothetical protein